MKKLDRRSRLRRMLVIGIAFRLAAGCFVYRFGCKFSCIKKESEFAVEKEALKKKNDELKQTIIKHEATNNSAETLGSDARRMGVGSRE